MCGIVGIFRHGMTNLDVDLFERMLLADVFRGDHSTGAFRLLADKINTEIYKDATPSPFYLYSEGWEMLRGDTVPGSKKHQALSPLYVGHNRYATMGAKTPQNAHPFNVGKITLVHNGSITKSRMSNDRDFDVDSHGICDLIDKKGLDEALKEMDGAFALVWWNSEEKTLNFFRNDKRPMHINKYTDGTYAWASEGQMMDWIFTRKGTSSTVVKTLERSFSLPVGMLFQLHYDGTTITELGFTKKTLPTFPYYSGYSSSTSRSYSTYTPQSEADRFAERFAEAGISLKGIKTPANELVLKLDNVSITRTGTAMSTTGQLEAELFGLGDALDILDSDDTEAGVYFLEGYLSGSEDANLMAYSVSLKDWDEKFSSSEELYADIVNVYTNGSNKDKKLKITIKNIRTSLTEEEKGKLLNEQLVPLEAEFFETTQETDVKVVSAESTESMLAISQRMLENLDKELGFDDDIPFSEGGNVVEATVKNLSGTIRSVKQINETATSCHFCLHPMDVEDFKESTTWCDKKSLICSYCSQFNK